MAVKYQNFTHSFNLNGKPVFAPTEVGYRIGRDIKKLVETSYNFEDFYYHLRCGGHVAALHGHRENAYFCKVDIENFFYSIPRNRVIRCLKSIGISRHSHYAKWSCVKNPFTPPSYALPYGFVQSPILASLVLSRSELGEFLRDATKEFNVAVYVDDISLSGNDLSALNDAYLRLNDAADRAMLKLNPTKSVKPSEFLEVFNCSLETGKAEVTHSRIADFYKYGHPPSSVRAFEGYCSSVSKGNR